MGSGASVALDKAAQSGRAIVVMGVSGCGKSTVGRALADVLGWDFLDADDFHPSANVRKMAAGIPLTDGDRAPWLEILRGALAERLQQGTGVVLACSALCRRYRDILRQAGDVRFAHLRVERAELAARLAGRQGHFFATALLDSQLATLEPLEPDESGAAFAPAPLPDLVRSIRNSACAGGAHGV